MKKHHAIVSGGCRRFSKRTVSLLVALAGTIAVVMPAHADYLDAFWTDEDPAPPYDPVADDPDPGWNWRNPPWSHRPTEPVPDGTAISAGKARLFGLENLWLGEDYVKTVTLEFDYAGGRPESSARNYGYHPDNQPEASNDSWDETDTGTHYKLVWQIDPQPDWEWIAIRNESALSGVMTISNFSLTSECVPEPASLLLLALGGLAALRRRRVQHA